MTEQNVGMMLLAIFLTLIACVLFMWAYLHYDSEKRRPVGLRRYRRVFIFVALGVALVFTGVTGVFLVRSHDRSNFEQLERNRKERDRQRINLEGPPIAALFACTFRLFVYIITFMLSLNIDNMVLFYL